MAGLAEKLHKGDRKYFFMYHITTSSQAFLFLKGNFIFNLPVFYSTYCIKVKAKEINKEYYKEKEEIKMLFVS